MASITLNTTNDQDVAVQRATSEYNATATDTLTALQWFKQIFLGPMLDQLINKYVDRDVETKAELYQKASDADKATIDAILQKYA